MVSKPKINARVYNELACVAVLLCHYAFNTLSVVVHCVGADHYCD
jgi:hypothetical protein